MKPYKGNLQMKAGYQKEKEGVHIAKSIEERVSQARKHYLYKGVHRNGYHKPRSKPNTISHSHLLLMGFTFPCHSRDLSLYLGYLFLVYVAHLIGLDEGPPILKLGNPHKVLALGDT